MWKLFGGCIYNLEVPCWGIFYAGTKCLRICWHEWKTVQNARYVHQNISTAKKKKPFSNTIIRTVHWILLLSETWYRAARQQFTEVSEELVTSSTETSAIFYHTTRLHVTADYLHSQNCWEPLSSRIIKPIVDSISLRARACARGQLWYKTYNGRVLVLRSTVLDNNIQSMRISR